MTTIVLEDNFINDPIPDLNTLKSINTTNVRDGVTYKVKTLGLFYLDKTSIETANDVDIIQPTSGPGRFKRLTLPFMVTSTGGTKIDPSMLDASVSNNNNRLSYLEQCGLFEPFVFTVTSPTTFSVAAGRVQYVDNFTDVNNPVRTTISTPALTGITPIGLGSAVRTYLYWDLTSLPAITIYQSTSYVPRAEARTKVYFGIVVHSNLSTIDYVTQAGFYISQQGKYIEDLFFKFLLNNDFELTRMKFWYSGANLNLKFSALQSTLKNGELISLIGSSAVARDIITMPAVNPIPTLLRIYIDNLGIPHFTASSNVDPNNYRKSDGTLGVVPTGYWTAQRFFYFATGEKFVAYGLDYYPSDRLAIQGYLNENWATFLNNPVTAGAIFAGYLIVKQGATDLSNSSQAIFSDKINPTTITPVDVVNRGVVRDFTVTQTGGLNISWTEGMIYDVTNKVTVNITSGSGTCTNNALNYLYWISGTTLTLSTTKPSGNNVTIATLSVQAGTIYAINKKDDLTDREANLIRGIANVYPTKVTSGLMIYPDTDPTNNFDVYSEAGTYYVELTTEKVLSAIYSRLIPMVRHYHSGGNWTVSTNAQIDNLNYDNGTNLAPLPNNSYSKSLFILNGGVIHWVYPRATYTNLANATAAPNPEIPPGIKNLVVICAYVHQQSDTALMPAGDPRWIDLRGVIG